MFGYIIASVSVYTIAHLIIMETPQ